MINKYNLILLLPIFLLGCKPVKIPENILIQKIDNLDMNIYSNNGEKIYAINSPESSFDKQNNIFNLKETTINLYNNEVIKYIIYSKESRLSNNNKKVELIGNVELITIDQENETLYANNFVWNINDSIYILNGDVKFENNNIILRSNKAILNGESVIEFINPVIYVIKNENNEESYEINSENAFYNINTNSVRFESTNNQVRSKIYF